MSISSKVRAERQAKERKRWKKRQAKRDIIVFGSELEQPFETPIRFSEFFADQPDPDINTRGPLKHVTFDITFEAIPDSAYHALAPEWRQRLDPICLEPIQDLREHIDLLEQATKADLPVPRLWNMLGNAYLQQKRSKEAGAVYEETIKRFPDYFFGYISYATWLIQQGRLDEVSEALGGNFDLERLLRGRTQVHHSEMLAYHGMLVQYFMALDNLRQAAISMDFLEEVEPEHPVTISLRQRMLLKLLSQITPLVEKE
jgi:tetratricopeptide (TPR) repeat protein